jgi:HEAT repeat protein
LRLKEIARADQSAAVRAEAVAVIRWVPDDALRAEIAIDAMEDGDPGVRLAAVQTLGGLAAPGSDVFRLINRAASDSDEQVRQEATKILERLAKASDGER